MNIFANLKTPTNKSDCDNMEKLIGREKEEEKLREYYDSDRSEFVALYGRRRVGKTFLIRKFFNDKFDFYTTGIIEGSSDLQMEVFYQSLLRYGFKGEKPTTWLEAFSKLADLLEKKNRGKEGRLVVFIDELPCFDTPRSGFLEALDFFWNSRASWMVNIFFVVCGSATSWMMSKIVNNRAGLHKRATHTMHLRPFTLGQTEKFLNSKKFRWPRIAILQIYMVLGGVPYYLGLLNPKKNVPDNIDSLFFSSTPELENEFPRLFNSLFRNAGDYMEVIRLLSGNRDGYTRTEIVDKLKVADNGHLSTILENLEHCDFIRKYNNGTLRKNGIYQLIDFFSLFHYKFGRSKSTDEHFWRNSLGTPEQNIWYGLTFEKVCLCHVPQIVEGLGLERIRHEYFAWRSKNASPSVQIDLVIDRADGIATICEMKYSKEEYTINESEYKKIMRRMEVFGSETRHKGGVQASIVTTYGLHENMYSEISPVAITMDDLFK